MMDAISFVLGVQSKHLRSNNLKDLVFRKSISSAPARKASVKLIYELSAHELNDCNEGTELIFCRNISSAGVSSYRLNDKDVSYERYEQTLQVIGTTSYHDLYYNFIIIIIVIFFIIIIISIIIIMSIMFYIQIYVY